MVPQMDGKSRMHVDRDGHYSILDSALSLCPRMLLSHTVYRPKRRRPPSPNLQPYLLRIPLGASGPAIPWLYELCLTLIQAITM